jgi:hypothetical protein
MKAIYALSSALILFFGLQGSVSSASTLASTFDEGDEGWGLSGSGEIRVGFCKGRARAEAGDARRLRPGLETGAGTWEGY